MTEKLLKNRAWRLRNLLPVLAALLPCFGWLALGIMGHRSGRKPLSRTARVYAVLNMGALAVCVLMPLGITLSFLIRGSFGQDVTLMRELGDYAATLLMLLWPVCLVHTLVCAGDYLRYLALRTANQPRPQPLLKDRVWRRENSAWILWAALPMVGGFANIFAGCRMGSKKLRNFGISGELILLALTLACDILFPFQYRVHGNLQDIRLVAILAVWVTQLAGALTVREAYLSHRAVVFAGDTHRQPHLNSRKWRLRAGAWQLWTLSPLTGGIGIGLAGLRCGKRKYVRLGAALCLTAGAIFVLTTCLEPIAAALGLTLSLKQRNCVTGNLNTLGNALYLATLLMGMVIRWEVLLGRAEALQGYESEFHRDLALQNRLQTPKAPPKTTPKAPPKAPAKPDINRCTREELMALPGMTLAQCARVMEHRKTGGFRDVDEFVDLLEIKPHFAVQIFEMVTVSPMEKPKTGESNVRRRIDF